jgi:hypothetical protein
MRIIFKMIIVLFSISYIFPQEGEGKLGWGVGEIYIGTRGLFLIK